MRTYVLRHLQVFFDTIGRMAKSPLPTLITISVIGIAIALPLILLKISNSFETITGQWQGNPELTVFMSNLDAAGKHSDYSDENAVDLGHKLLQIPTIKDVEYISPEQAIIEFKSTSGLGDILDGMVENPLPPILIVFPETDLNSDDVRALVTQLESMYEVDSISYDQQWLERLSAIIQLFRYGVGILSCLMGVAVLLIVSNSIRIGILNRSDEIQIIDQIGGTAAFIRRPFLYYGALQGICGALFSLIISNIALYILSAPVETLTELYQSNFKIGWTSLTTNILVIALAAVLGWLAARITVGSYLWQRRASARER